MSSINRDTIIAIILLVMCGVLLHATFEIREPDYGVLSPSAWPRVIVGVVSLLSLIYLIQSIAVGPGQQDTAAVSDDQPRNLVSFCLYWRNPFYCFALFLAFLIALPTLGMLIGGISFVFLLLNMLGGWAPKKLLLHAAIAIIAIGTMWSIFTYGLNVILPRGTVIDWFN